MLGLPLTQASASAPPGGRDSLPRLPASPRPRCPWQSFPASPWKTEDKNSPIPGMRRGHPATAAPEHREEPAAARPVPEDLRAAGARCTAAGDPRPGEGAGRAGRAGREVAAQPREATHHHMRAGQGEGLGADERGQHVEQQHERHEAGAHEQQHHRSAGRSGAGGAGITRGRAAGAGVWVPGGRAAAEGKRRSRRGRDRGGAAPPAETREPVRGGRGVGRPAASPRPRSPVPGPRGAP